MQLLVGIAGFTFSIIWLAAAVHRRLYTTQETLEDSFFCAQRTRKCVEEHINNHKSLNGFFSWDWIHYFQATCATTVCWPPRELISFEIANVKLIRHCLEVIGVTLLHLHPFVGGVNDAGTSCWFRCWGVKQKVIRWLLAWHSTPLKKWCVQLWTLKWFSACLCNLGSIEKGLNRNPDPASFQISRLNSVFNISANLQNLTRSTIQSIMRSRWCSFHMHQQHREPG